jgi:hypothetical protein
VVCALTGQIKHQIINDYYIDLTTSQITKH